jgi:beta-glucosidase/6-phospho-beta-glucosidase/beta-galactosidase
LALQLAQGIVETVEAIKEIDPGAVMVHVEAAGLVKAADEELESLAAEEEQRRFLSYDLVTGRVTAAHPLFPWLLQHGASREALRELERRPLALDVQGLNYYPQWSTRELYLKRTGRLASRVIASEASDFTEVLTRHYERYGAPIVVTETSAHGSDAVRATWLQTSLAAIRELRGRAIPVVGYTWFPMFTMVDWRYRFGRRPIQDYWLELGLYRLRQTDSHSRWQRTGLVEQLRGYVTSPDAAVGPLRTDPPSLEGRDGR